MLWCNMAWFEAELKELLWSWLFPNNRMSWTEVLIDFLVVCHFDGQGRKNSVISYYPLLLFIFCFYI